jgi:hypothetical protein
MGSSRTCTVAFLGGRACVIGSFKSATSTASMGKAWAGTVEGAIAGDDLATAWTYLGVVVRILGTSN